jgi:methylase of polypeptide subunit release factors
LNTLRKTSNRWIETSRREQTVAIQLADAFRSRLAEALTPSALVSVAMAIFLGRFDSIASEMKDILLPLKDSVSGTFATTDDSLSSNLFARLAFLLGRNSDEHRLAGSVATPHFLAQEMVRVALFYRFEKILAPSNTAKLRLVLSNQASHFKLSLSERQTIHALLSSFRWCDPCLGGGVFPLAIINTFHHLGLPLSNLSPGVIDAFEICPYAAAAARIRIAHYIAAITNSTYEITLSDLYVNIHERDALEAMPEAPEVYTRALAYDFVVGNPPYVRSDILERTTKTLLRNRFPSLGAKNLDLYFYFVASGLLHLKPSGILAFVSSASFQRTLHGALLRSFIAKNGTLRAIVDFGELPVFPEASVPHTSVYVIKAGISKDKEQPRGAMLQALPERSLLEILANGFQIPSSNISSKIWHISKASDGDLVQALAANSFSLKDVLGPVYSGIKTGCAKAYVISKDEHNSLLKAGAPESLFKPVLIPTDIQPWQSTWSGRVIIFVPRGFVLNPDCPVFRHLSNFADKLKSRKDLRDGMTWYSLRTCSYYPLFETPKIVFPDIAKEPRFCFDLNSFYLPDGAFFIQSNHPVFVSILNSLVGAFYFRRTCSSIGYHEFGGRLRFKKAYVEQFPIPNRLLSDPTARNAIERAAEPLILGRLSLESEREVQVELARSVLACYDLNKSSASKIARAIKI